MSSCSVSPFSNSMSSMFMNLIIIASFLAAMVAGDIDDNVSETRHWLTSIGILLVFFHLMMPSAFIDLVIIAVAVALLVYNEMAAENKSDWVMVAAIIIIIAALLNFLGDWRNNRRMSPSFSSSSRRSKR